MNPATPAPCAVLLVEDDALNADMLARRLRRRGWAVDIAGDGRVAVERVQTQRYSLVLMDLDMPHMDGWAAMQALRDLGLGDLPLLVLSAHSLPEDRGRALALGVAGYFTKPLDLDALESRMCDLVAAPPAAGS